MIVQETLLFLQNLEDITSWLASDHILNLFPQLEGRLPEDKPKMLQILEDFLAADPERQRLYQVGRRCGMLAQLGDLDDPLVSSQVQELCRELAVRADNVDSVTDALMQRFI
jgi:hypothetical protein